VKGTKFHFEFVAYDDSPVQPNIITPQSYVVKII
jgi:hypothetical protein